MDDTISRQAAIDALWKALYKYEDETEKQFQTSEDLDVGDWIEHRIFVQNMNDIDRQTILNLPSAQPDLDTRLYTDGFSDGYKRAQMDARLTDADVQKMQDIEQAMLNKAYECGKQDAAQWIPVTERLPKPYEERRADETY